MVEKSHHKKAYYLVNGISLYRLVTAPLLLVLLFAGQVSLFKWLLLVSFCTDAIDGFLARQFRVVSLFGARLDSAADDLTMLVGIIGIVYLEPEFLRQQWLLIVVLFTAYLLQTALALYKYGKFTSFHTYLAKIAALCQGVFILLLLFLPEPPLLVFYIAAGVTLLDLVEEIALVLRLPRWQADVKGWFWLQKREG
jgi:CDP-diacylglycerol--glycerol-3-phosphate 3-phosphatidyltransferase